MANRGSRLFFFDYKIELNIGDAFCQRLLGLGRLFSSALGQALSVEAKRRPLLLICYGMGSFIVKKSVFQALAPQPPSPLYGTLSGIVFIGALHLVSASDGPWENWRRILKLHRKDVSETILGSKNFDELAQVCERFDKLNLQFRVMSVFQRPGVSRSRMFRSQKGSALVEEAYAITRSKGEYLVGLPLSYTDLQSVEPGGDLYRELLGFIHKLSPRRVAYESALEMPETAGPVTPQQQPLRGMCPITGYWARNAAFCGRDDILDQIHKVLMPSENQDSQGGDDDELGLSPFKSVLIHGMGGLGKTEIALEYVHRHKTEFQVIFWIDSSNQQGLKTGISVMRSKLGLSMTPQLRDPLYSNASDSSKLDSSIKWLIVFDNANDHSVLVDFWASDHLLLGGNGSAIVTSTNTPVGCFDPLFTIHLPPMTVEEGSHLFQRLYISGEQQGSIETWAAITAKVGGLPLAIARTALGMRYKHIRPDEFVNYYDRHAKEFHAYCDERLSEHYNLASRWKIERLQPSTLALLQIISVFDPVAIPEHILTGCLGEVKLQHYPKDIGAYIDARGDLITYHLVSHNISPRFLAIDGLLQDIVRYQMDTTTLENVYNTATELLLAVFPLAYCSNLYEVKRLREVQEYLPHVVAFKRVLQGKTGPVIQPHINVCALLNDASWFYILQQSGYSLLEAKQFASLSQVVLESESVSNRKARGYEDEELLDKLLADSYRYQGISEMHMNDISAVKRCRIWMFTLLSGIKRFNDPEDIQTLPIAHNEVGMAWMCTRYKDKAEEAEESWALACKASDQAAQPGKLAFPFPWVHRALIAAYYTGDYHAAETLVAPILEQREEHWERDGIATIETGLILAFMGNFRYLQGKSGEAYELHTRAASVLRSALGDNSVYASFAYYRLAVDEYERGMYSKAKELLEKCLPVYGDVPWYKPRSARCIWKLGRTLHAEGGNDNKAEGSKLLEKAMKLRRELAPDDKREESELGDQDWDELVFYFFR
ncbi:hypothetical protein AK830_g1366 [Neonectria ditissima]|uniref:DUF7779 domain-containing protein n=1 Tax=Neonectria ditissima TaxID=78410 RepID=A0A0P7BX50_9HYPO|nr:hypothetical protein AK830_g1366 [Neonectria ditissima]